MCYSLHVIPQEEFWQLTERRSKAQRHMERERHKVKQSKGWTSGWGLVVILILWLGPLTSSPGSLRRERDLASTTDN